MKKESNQRKIKQEGIELPTHASEPSFCPKQQLKDSDTSSFWHINSQSIKILEENNYKQEDIEFEDKELFDYESYYPTILPMKPVNKQTFDIDDDSHTINPRHLGNYFIQQKQKNIDDFEDNTNLDFHDKLSNNY